MSVTELQEQRQRYINAYGKGLINEDELELRMKEPDMRSKALKKQTAHTSTTRLLPAKLDVDEIVRRATARIQKLEFSQKKHIVEQVVDKVVANPKEVIIWGQIPVSVSTGVTEEKVKYGSQYRYSWPTECW